MRKRSRIALALLLLAVVGGIAWLILRPSVEDPIYKGKRLSEWLESYEPRFFFGGGNSSGKEAADEAVRHFGTNAIPTLLRRLRAKDSAIIDKLVALGTKQHFFRIKHTAAWLQLVEGVDGFEALGADGKYALPELLGVYEEKKHDFSDSLWAAAMAIGHIGPAAKEAVPVFLRGLADSDKRTCALSAWILGEIHAEPELVVPVLVKCLGDQDPGLRECAATALGRFGAGAKPAVPALRELVSDNTRAVSEAAKEALKKIDPEAAAKAEVKGELPP